MLQHVLEYFPNSSLAGCQVILKLNREFLSNVFGKFLVIFGDLYSFAGNMLPSKLIKFYSLIVDSFLVNSFSFLAKILFDCMSFT